MTTIHPGLGRLLAGCGGALLIGSLFLPWSDAAGVTHDGWQTLSAWDVFLVITGVSGIATFVGCESGGWRLLGAARSHSGCDRGGGLPRQIFVSEDAERRALRLIAEDCRDPSGGP